MEKKEMLLALIEHYDKGNKSQFSKRLGISAQGLSTWISRNTFDIETVYSKCENINPEWLLTGRGNMLKECANNPFTKEGDNNIDKYDQSDTSIDLGVCAQKMSIAKSPTKGIPLIPLSAMAGAFTGDTSVMEYECERYVIPAFKGADFLIQVKGDSMQPTYYSGVLVACERVPLNDIFFQWNKTYVLDTKQGPLIKRIMPGSDEEHIRIISDNSNYPPFELSKDQFNGVALVRGLVRLE